MCAKKNQHDLAEMLSAYLDGELSPAQVESVELRLADDPQARMLLEDMQQVAHSIRQLPQVAAPDDLANGVLQQFERDLVLNRDTQTSATAGEKNMQLRRFLTAAAMFCLIGAIVWIVYTVLKNPNYSWLNPNANKEDPIIAVNNPANDKTGTDADNTLRSIATYTPQDITPAQVFLSEINLAFKCSNPDQARQSLETWLISRNLTDVLRSTPQPDHYQYAFLCTHEQLQNLLRTQDRPHNRYDLTAISENGDEIIVFNATDTQILDLAREANTLRLYDQALTFAVANLKTLDFPYELSPELIEQLVRVEPELSNLRVLGPDKNSNQTSVTANKTHTSEQQEDKERQQSSDDIPTPKSLVNTGDRSKSESTTTNQTSITATGIALVLTIVGLPAESNADTEVNPLNQDTIDGQIELDIDGKTTSPNNIKPTEQENSNPKISDHAETKASPHNDNSISTSIIPNSGEMP